MVQIIQNIPLSINKNEVLRYLGYHKTKTHITSDINKMIDSLIDECHIWLKPKGIFKTIELSISNNKEIITSHENFCINASDVVNLFRGSDYLSILALTLGNTLDEKIASLFDQGEYTQATILDAIGSDGVEQLANKINGIIKQEAFRKGYHLTRRFSPGYGNWNIQAQKDLLDVLGTSKIGIFMTESYMLNPQKSITAILGWKRVINDHHNYNPCNKCLQQNCEYEEDRRE